MRFERPHRVDPERATDLTADLLRQDLVEDREEWARPRTRQLGALQDVDVEVQPLAGDARERLGVPVLRVGFVDVHQSGDVGGDRRREPAGHELPVPLHEGVGDHRLQQHHRRDDDDQRAGVEPLRQGVADGPADAPPELPDSAEKSAERTGPARFGRGEAGGGRHGILNRWRGDSRRRERCAGSSDWPDPARSCGAGG